MKETGKKKPLTTIVTLILVAGGVLAAVYGLGQNALGRMMRDDAVSTADLWSRSLGRHGDLEATLTATSPDALESTLHIASIDGVLLIPSDGDPIGIAGNNAASELAKVTAKVGGSAAPLYTIASGAYTLDSVSWISPHTRTIAG